MAKNTIVIDRGYTKAINRLREMFDEQEVVIGIVEADAQSVHDSLQSQGGKPGSKDLKIVELAAVHEFGTEHIPQRSFLSAWFDKNVREISQVISKVAAEMSEEKISEDQALGKIGLWGVASVQKRIQSGLSPKLQQATINRKGSSKPLIDTGRLWQSIRHVVRTKE